MNIININKNLENIEFNENTIFNISFGKFIFEECFKKRIDINIFNKIFNFIKKKNINYINIRNNNYTNYIYDNNFLIVLKNGSNFLYEKKIINSFSYNLNNIDILIYIYDKLSLYNDNFDSHYEYNDSNNIKETIFTLENDINISFITNINNNDEFYEINLNFTNTNNLDNINLLLNKLIPLFEA